MASRLVERFCRPVFVLSNGQDGPGNEPCFTGSGRSIPAFHLLGALETMPELFTKFGGHRQAAGLTLRAADVAEFRKRFAEVGSRLLTSDHLRPQYTVDATVEFSGIDRNLCGRRAFVGTVRFRECIADHCRV